MTEYCHLEIISTLVYQSSSACSSSDAVASNERQEEEEEERTVEVLDWNFHSRKIINAHFRGPRSKRITETLESDRAQGTAPVVQIRLSPSCFHLLNSIQAELNFVLEAALKQDESESTLRVPTITITTNNDVKLVCNTPIGVPFRAILPSWLTKEQVRVETSTKSSFKEEEQQSNLEVFSGSVEICCLEIVLELPQTFVRKVMHAERVKNESSKLDLWGKLFAEVRDHHIEMEQTVTWCFLRTRLIGSLNTLKSDGRLVQFHAKSQEIPLTMKLFVQNREGSAAWESFIESSRTLDQDRNALSYPWTFNLNMFYARAQNLNLCEQLLHEVEELKRFNSQEPLEKRLTMITPFDNPMPRARTATLIDLKSDLGSKKPQKKNAVLLHWLSFERYSNVDSDDGLAVRSRAIDLRRCSVESRASDFFTKLEKYGISDDVCMNESEQFQLMTLESPVLRDGHDDVFSSQASTPRNSICVSPRTMRTVCYLISDHMAKLVKKTKTETLEKSPEEEHETLPKLQKIEEDSEAENEEEEGHNASFHSIPDQVRTNLLSVFSSPFSQRQSQDVVDGEESDLENEEDEEEEEEEDLAGFDELDNCPNGQSAKMSRMLLHSFSESTVTNVEPNVSYETELALKSMFLKSFRGEIQNRLSRRQQQQRDSLREVAEESEDEGSQTRSALKKFFDKMAIAELDSNKPNINQIDKGHDDSPKTFFIKINSNNSMWLNLSPNILKSFTLMLSVFQAPDLAARDGNNMFLNSDSNNQLHRLLNRKTREDSTYRHHQSVLTDRSDSTKMEIGALHTALDERNVQDKTNKICLKLVNETGLGLNIIGFSTRMTANDDNYEKEDFARVSKMMQKDVMDGAARAFDLGSQVSLESGSTTSTDALYTGKEIFNRIEFVEASWAQPDNEMAKNPKLACPASLPCLRCQFTGFREFDLSLKLLQPMTTGRCFNIILYRNTPPEAS
ncbi:hypothetical protein Ciccas_009564 [Cichlidogyrus casuarinus]|uniref:Uncharacterized protein n=1 Tax=Cichlidogyrus casuarinus TaxID=1844966 RepID=A0ABD2PWX4_9PLAT